jgi:quercetin dioxygenase-like cupin family protein
MSTLSKNPFLEDELKDHASIFQPGEGEILQMGGSKITLKVTSAISNDQLGVYEIELAPGTIGARPHYHRFMDETFIVTEGLLTVQHGETEVEAPAGSVIYIPRFTPHAFTNRSAERAVTTLIFNPAQKREGFFYGLRQILTAMPVKPEDYLALYNKYDSYPVDAANMLPTHEK